MIRKLVRRISHKKGLPPGSLVHVGDRPDYRVTITLEDYCAEFIEEKVVDNAEEVCDYRQKESVTWIDLDGVHEPEMIGKLGKCYGLHPLVLEDILNTAQRPKLEDYENCLFITLRALRFEEGRGVRGDHVSLVLGDNYTLSFRESRNDVFAPVRARLRAGKGRIRNMGPDYTAYALVDTLVDGYFEVMEKLAEKIENLEEELIEHPGPLTLSGIYEQKKELILLRRSVWPLRDVMAAAQKDESGLISEEVRPFFRDVQDHLNSVMDNIETFREILDGMHDNYMSLLGNRANAVMQVLTVIASIFIPLTFLAGIYGMNFDHMPELHVAWAYPALLVVMALLGLAMLLYFKRKGWL